MKKENRWCFGKITVWILVMALSFPFSAAVKGQEEFLPEGSYYYGDVDTNGIVEATDAIAILRHVVKLQELSALGEYAMTLGDVNHKNGVNVDDALDILKIAVKLREKEIWENPHVSKEPAHPLDVVNGEPIPLWNQKEDVPYYDPSIDQKIPAITPYLADYKEREDAVIIFPGGGYIQDWDVIPQTEREDVASMLQSWGTTAFVVEYRVAPYGREAILSDAFRAVRFVRYYAENFGIDPDRITLMGFSAGGHLAAMVMEHADGDGLDVAGDEIDLESAMPDREALCYPVLSMRDGYTHKTTRENFLGMDHVTDQQLIEKYSAELGVTEDLPPTFLWHSRADKAVSYEGTQLMADALTRMNVPCEFHLYNRVNHGVGLAGGTEASDWMEKLMDWLDRMNKNY